MSSVWPSSAFWGPIRLTSSGLFSSHLGLKLGVLIAVLAVLPLVFA
jgi:hypothetical protein